MTPPKRPTPKAHRGVLWISGAAAGVVASVLLYGMFWMLARPRRTVPQAFDEVIRRFATPNVIFLWWLVGGLVGGIVLASLARADSPARSFARGAWALLVLVATGVVGAALGIFVYLLAWTASFPALNFNEALIEVQSGFATLDPALLLFVTAGALLGTAIGAHLVGSKPVQTLAGSIAGITLGSLAGLLLYAVAYVALSPPASARGESLLFAFGEAVSAFSALELFFVCFGAVLGLLMARYSWRFYGLVTLVSLVAVVVGFLGYSLFVTLPKVEPQYSAFAIALFVCESFSLIMVLLYSFYTIDVATRKHWRKQPRDSEHSQFYCPKVAFQVCVFNEPPELVLESLRRLLRIDYPTDRFVIMVLDDSTKPELRRPIETYAKEHGLIYVHREDRKGFKAGALNHAIQFAPPDADLFAIIDADYQVAPEYLRETVGYFIDPRIAWVQTPQDYRNRHQSYLTEQYYLADAYFYRTVMPSRNEENTIIFCGTMGIVRRQALERVGGWGEKYISEDAELSFRLLTSGYESLYINKTYGRGLIPPTFEGYKKQHYRWASGGAKILRGHFWGILFGRLSRRQAFDYFVGSAHWFEGLFILTLAGILMLIAGAEILGAPLATHHSQEILLVGLVPFLLLTDGITRLHTVMRDKMRLSLGQTLRVLGMWFSVKFSNSFGALKSFVGFNVPFVRTPKAPDERVGRGEALRRALQVAPFESFMAALLFVLAAGIGFKIWLLSQRTTGVLLTRFFLLFWLLYYVFVFSAAPRYAYKSYVTFRPDAELQAKTPATPRTAAE